MIIYLIKCTIAMGIGWAIYGLFLADKKTFILNRLFLLSAIIGSAMAPLITLPFNFLKISISDGIYPLLEVAQSSVPKVTKTPTVQNHGNTIDLFLWIAMAITIILSLRFLYRIIRLIRLQIKPTIIRKEGIRIVIINDDHTPYSFYNSIYINPIDYAQGLNEAVFHHEKYHIRHWHSLDRIIIEFISIFLWMNPFLHLLRRELIDNHEFAADAYVIDKTRDISSYLTLLLNTVRSTSSKSSVISQFYHSSSLKRIKMLTTIQKTSKYWYQTMAIFLLIGCLISCSNELDEQTLSESNSDDNISQVSNLKKKNKFLTKMGYPAPPPPPIPPVNRPSMRLLEKWSQDKTFGLILDGEIIDNQTLMQYLPDDISLYMVRAPHNKSKLFGKYEYEVQLITNNGYKIVQSKREKLLEEYYNFYPNGYVYQPKNIN